MGRNSNSIWMKRKGGGMIMTKRPSCQWPSANFRPRSCGIELGEGGVAEDHPGAELSHSRTWSSKSCIGCTDFYM